MGQFYKEISKFGFFKLVKSQNRVRVGSVNYIVLTKIGQGNEWYKTKALLIFLTVIKAK